MPDLADFLLWAHIDDRICIILIAVQLNYVCYCQPFLELSPSHLHAWIYRSITMWVRSAQLPHSTNIWSNSRPATLLPHPVFPSGPGRPPFCYSLDGENLCVAAEQLSQSVFDLCILLSDSDLI